MDNNNITLMTYFNIIWKNKLKIFWISFAVGMISIIISLFLPKWYNSTAVILSPSSNSGGLAGLGGLANLGIGNLLGDNESIFKYMAILKSRGLKEKVVKKFNLVEKYESDNIEQAVKKFNENYRMEMGDEFQISISVLDKDQELVADMTNFIVKCLDTMNIEFSVKKARKDRLNIEQRYYQLIDSLHIVTNDLAEYMEKNNIINLEGQTTIGVEASVQLLSQIFAIKTEVDVMKQTFKQNNQILKNREIELNNLKNEYKQLVTQNKNFIPAFNEIPKLGVDIKKYEFTIKYLSKVIEFVGIMYSLGKQTDC